MREEAIKAVRERLTVGCASAFIPGEPVVHKALGVCPLCLDSDGVLEYTTYEEALDRDVITVREVDEGGSVPVLSLRNFGADRVLILDGEQLVGAKQNRVLNTTILVDSRSKMTIPVTCVEAGRWSYREGRQEMRSSAAPLYAMTRAQKSRQVFESLRYTRSYSADQRAIWDDIQTRLSANHVDSSTAAMEDHYREIHDDLADFVANLSFQRLSEGGAPVGAVFTLAGKVMGMDAFDKSTTLQKQWAKLLNSYAIEALRVDREGSADRQEIEEFLRCAAASEMQVFEPPGLGVDVRFTSERVVGSALVVNGEVIHCYAFNIVNGDRGEESARIRSRMNEYSQRVMRRRLQDEI